jgi:hypothetical protein
MKKGIHLWIGLGFLLVSQTALILRIPLMTTYFYSLIWWSYIVAMDGIIFRLRGNSLIVNRTGRFFLLIPWSVTIWLVFEGFNLVLNNWFYIGVPQPIFLRWPGYFVAFGTVLPAIFETKDLLSTLGVCEQSRRVPIQVRSSWYRPMIIVGVLCLILPLLLPLYCFPLVWLGFVFLLEPFNFQTGRPSLLRDLRDGSLRNLYQLLLSGMICGLLWEFWNFWARAKWVYSVPWVGQVKIFEMPVLGFFGFPPFAVECYVLVHFLRLLEPGQQGKKKFTWRALPFWLLFYGIMFAAIDMYTVRSYGG